MTRYIIFTRVSTDQQKVENQFKECKMYVDENMQPGDELTYFDEPETSSRIPADKREELQKMIAYARKGDVLVIYKLDRIARDGQELVNIYRNLRKKGVTIHSINEPACDDEYIHILAYVAMIERKNVRLRTMSALKRKRADGERVGTTEYGYRLDETKLSTHKNAHSEGKPYLLLEDPVEMNNINLMRKLYHEGVSYRQIEKKLREKGVVNRKGNPFHLSMIHKLIHRTAQTMPQELDLAA